jgi:hypothetical protein
MQRLGVEVTFQTVLAHVVGPHTEGGGHDMTRQTGNPKTGTKPYYM